MSDVDRGARRDMFRLVLFGLHEPTGDPRRDGDDRLAAIGASMDLLAYIEGLEVALEKARIRLLHADDVDRAQAGELRTDLRGGLGGEA